MAIGGKLFDITYEDYFPTLKIDLIIGSPNPNISEQHRIKSVVIDTGSDFTLISNNIIEVLGLFPTGNTMIITGFNGAETPVNFYSAKVIIEDVLEDILLIGGIDAEPIIGMDLISKMHILMNCPNGTFELANNINYRPIII